MRIWIDDIRPAPEGYIKMEKVNEIIPFIHNHFNEIEEISFDNDAGEFVGYGGDYRRVMDWLESIYGSNIPFKFDIHSWNPVERERMKQIIERNGWKTK